MARQTQVTIEGEDFSINGRPTYPGRTWRGHRVEGLLLNARMVNAIFDDLNPETRGWWAYPDTGEWDPERNVREFLEMLPEYRRHGLLGSTINLQGGSPEGYSRATLEKGAVRGSPLGGKFSEAQPWENSGFTPEGALRPEYFARLERVLERADELGMVVIVGYFYQGQDERLVDEAAVLRAVDGATDFLLDGGHTNVLVEINNECNTRYEHPVLQPERVHELIARVKERDRNGRRLLVSTSYGGRGRIPDESVVAVADYLLIHGNGTADPDLIAEQVERTRAVAGDRPVPVVFNEDDHFDFERPWNNFVAAVSRRASWGYFDPGAGAGGAGARGDYINGYQLVPVNWGINTERKRAFFDLLREITGS